MNLLLQNWSTLFYLILEYFYKNQELLHLFIVCAPVPVCLSTRVKGRVVMLYKWGALLLAWCLWGLTDYISSDDVSFPSTDVPAPTVSHWDIYQCSLNCPCRIAEICAPGAPSLFSFQHVCKCQCRFLLYNQILFLQNDLYCVYCLIISGAVSYTALYLFLCPFKGTGLCFVHALF